jgi:hypothetical protein
LNRRDPSLCPLLSARAVTGGCTRPELATMAPPGEIRGGFFVAPPAAPAKLRQTKKTRASGVTNSPTATRRSISERTSSGVEGGGKSVKDGRGQIVHSEHFAPIRLSNPHEPRCRWAAHIELGLAPLQEEAVTKPLLLPDQRPTDLDDYPQPSS